VSSSRTDVTVLATLAVVFAVLATAIQAHRLARFDVRSFDLAIFAQGVWALGHGHDASSIQETSFLGVHFSPLMFALAPLARLAGSATPLLLVFVQGLALGASAPLAYLIARPAGRGPSLALGVAVLAHPALRALALDGFHDLCLGVPLALLLALAIERAWSERALIGVALATALLADEQLSLVLPGAALWLAFEKRRREGATVLALGAVTFLVVNFGVLGWLRGGALHVESLYDHWKNPELLLRFLPGATKETFVLALGLIGPLAFLPLVRPTRLAPAGIVFLLSFASLRSAQRSLHEHYHAPITPFVIAAAASALVRLEERRRGGARAGAALVMAATLVALGVDRRERESAPPENALLSEVRDLAEGPADPRAELVARIPEDASVLASIDFLHVLSARERLFGLPAAIRGTKDWSSVPYELPGELDFVLADTMDSASFSPTLDDPRSAEAALALGRWEAIALDRRLGVLATEGSTVLLGRGGPSLVAAAEPRGSPRELLSDPHAPLLVSVEADAITWAPPPAGLGAVYVELSTGGGPRPILWRLFRVRPWPPGKNLRECASVPPGPLSLRLLTPHRIGDWVAVR
jgi:uncharacterized membrane protein